MSLEKPDWFSIPDRFLYDELLGKPNKTPKEEQFVKTMYHFEEYACGLDGV